MTLILNFASWLISRVSDKNLERGTYALAWFLFHVLGFRKALVRKNIANVFRGKLTLAQMDEIAVKSYQSLALTTCEFLESKFHNVAKNATITNPQVVRDALAGGKGCYILCTHMANWEAVAASVCQQISPAYVPVKKVGGKAVNSFVEGLRRNYGLHTAERKVKGDSFKIIQATLGRGEPVGFMQDQARPGSPRLPFFGVDAKTNVSMAAIWYKVTAPVIPSIGRRISARHHVIEFLPPMTLKRSEDADADLIENARRMNSVVEAIILANPEQYLWLHDRWK